VTASPGTRVKSQAPYAVGGSVTANPGTRVKSQAPYAVGGSVTASPGIHYILPLVFLKRLSGVFDDEMARLAGEFGSQQSPCIPQPAHLRPQGFGLQYSTVH
jgi:hypothetical protein